MIRKLNLQKVLVLGLGLLVLCAWTVPAAMADLQDPDGTPKYAVDMPVIEKAGLRVDATRGGRGGYTVNIVNSEHDFGLEGATPQLPKTPIYAYQFPGLPPTYPGATIVAERNRRVNIQWRNMLDGADDPFPTGHVLAGLVDTSLHIAHPQYGVPAVVHVHGGHTESASDGLPEAWYTQGWDETGDHHVKRTYRYDNTQEAGTIWYHDHALGITRLNVYAGLAGFFLIRDDNEYELIDKGYIPSGDQEIEIAIQDRMFTDKGDDFLLTLPLATEPELGPECTLPEIDEPCDDFDGGNDPWQRPSIVAEFFGDHIVVNGKVWPKLAVGQGQYRFRLLNGSDSRFYVLQLRDDDTGGATDGEIDDGEALERMWVIGTDDGFLDSPVRPSSGDNPNTLLIAPGERYDVVVDFSGLDGESIYLRNFGADEPFKGFTETGEISDGDGGTLTPSEFTTQVMRFDVTDTEVTAPVDEETELRPLLDPIPSVEVGDEDNARSLVLFEGLDNFGRLQPLLGTLDDGSLVWDDAITENPALDATELWEVYNTTADAHPIHLHLVAFRILNRDGFTGDVEAKEQVQHDDAIGLGFKLPEDNITLYGDDVDPEPWEDGWKDTAVMLPGQVTRVIATFDRPGRYVWHCHILSHEDHEMMRPFHVGPMLPMGPPS